MKTDWDVVNYELIAKSIGELTYEEVLNPTPVNDSLPQEHIKDYQLKLKSNVTYTFAAWMTTWGYLRVKAKTLKRLAQTPQPLNLESKLTAAQFYLDAKAELGMNDITLAKFLEEMKSTLFSDQILLRKNQDISVKDLIDKSFLELQSYLNGHPKILLNKGRMGWSPKEILDYAPESTKGFKLRYLAVKKDLALVSTNDRLELNKVYNSLLSEKELQRIEAVLMAANKTPKDYIYIPVHPWQWEKIIQLHFMHEIMNEDIFDLGTLGQTYFPQISLRTLSLLNETGYDIKLPLSILNTSAVRGISSKSISKSTQISQTVADICKQDELLKTLGTDVLKDTFAISVISSDYQQIKQAPYRYHEFLGFILRESVGSKLCDNEKAVMTGALFHQDAKGQSLAGAYIKASGLSLEQWLKCYFETVVIPLYHLQLKYGLGLVAHGQNIVLKMQNNIPSGLLIKDFQGDLRAAKEFGYQNSVLNHLEKLPAEHLIHDLFTGHILTVLRFVSATLFESEQFSEKEFYKILSLCIKNYLNSQDVKLLTSYLNLLNPYFHRVLLNKVRFEMGYEDTTERLKPFLGSDLKNPLNYGEINGLANV